MERTRAAPSRAPGERASSLPSTALAAALFAVLGAVALLCYFPTLSLSYAYDDVDYLNEAAQVMAGRQGFWTTMLRSHNEHVTVGYRLVQHGVAALFGVDATPLRLLVLLVHVASGWLLGLAAFAATRSGPAAFAAGLAYVGACGFSSMWVWFPSGASVPLGLLAFNAGLLALALRARLGAARARALAGGALTLALLCETTLAPLAATLMLLDAVERRREGLRAVGLFTVYCASVALAAMLLTALQFTHGAGTRLSMNFTHGLPRAAYLLAVAPFRYAFPGLPVHASQSGLKTALLGAAFGTVVAAAVGALLLVLWRRVAPRLAATAVLAAAGPLGVVGLVGLGRWRSAYWELYDADRYFFTLLIPIALLTAAATASVASALRAWPSRARTALLFLLAFGLAAELAIHRRAMLGRIPFDVYADHQRRYDTLAFLAGRLEQAARALPAGSPPLELPDDDLWFPEIHNGHLSAELFLYLIGDGESERLRLKKEGEVAEEHEARQLDPVLDDWAREIGEVTPYFAIRNGRLANTRVVPVADFRRDAHEGAVVSGFSSWEGASRWMGRRGELELTLTSSGLAFELAAPMEILRRAHPEWRTVRVRVSVRDQATGLLVPVGTLEVASEEISLHRLDASSFQNRLGAGRTVRLILESDQVWRPSEVLPGSRDERELTVEVFRAGVEAPPS